MAGTSPDEFEAKTLTNGPKFVERMKRQDPRHATYYCEHGTYIGSNGLFAHKCKPCNPETKETKET